MDKRDRAYISAILIIVAATILFIIVGDIRTDNQIQALEERVVNIEQKLSK